ncbi:MAG: lipoyl synthase [Deltaproteobacteria bacterium]|nr:lipoyl synthase [Deltaproteobacteria bacterium]MBW2120569.1 lipoyl synthase [Deltaproteobacteria bacterium]
MVSRKPPWLRKKVDFSSIRAMEAVTGRFGLHTICESALCPNQSECFARGTATFLILGDRCTRNCRFCNVAHGRPEPLDRDEPLRVARAVMHLGLRYAVVTSVTRDDLEDGGAEQFARTIRAIKGLDMGVRVEVLVPDFLDAIDRVVEAGPEVINHNLETVPRLYPEVRPGADYRRSLGLLEKVKETGKGIRTKSGLMLGLGEEEEEILHVMKDLRRAGCDMLTLGQYLSPSRAHLPVREYVPPERFEWFGEVAKEMGFLFVASGPFVRSSYFAEAWLEKQG